jgi:hypothetical protein
LDWAALRFAISTSVFPEERALATLETGYGRGIVFLIPPRSMDMGCRNIGLGTFFATSRELMLHIRSSPFDHPARVLSA